MSDEPKTAFELDQHKVASAIHGLMSSASDLSKLADDRFLGSLVRLEYEDIELAHAHIGRLLDRVRSNA